MNDNFWTIVIAAAAIATANLTAFGFVFLAFHSFRADLRALNTRIDNILLYDRRPPSSCHIQGEGAGQVTPRAT